MKVVGVLLCISGCVCLSLAQIGFFLQRDERASPFEFAQSFLPNPNRIRNRLSGLFNVRPRPGSIIYDENPQTGSPIYDQNGFNRPVVFPTVNPEERPNVRPEYNPITTEQIYQNNQPNQGIPNQQYTEMPVAFPVEDNQPTAGSNDNLSPSNVGNEGAQSYQESSQTQSDQNSGQQNKENENTSDVGTVPNDFIVMTTILPSLEEHAVKDENRFGSGDSLPDISQVAAPESEFKNVNYDPAAIFTAESCQTVENEVGSCINLKKCDGYYKLVQDFKTNPGAVQLLRSAHCGFEGSDPKVCCPRQAVPTFPPQTTTTTTTRPTTTTTTSPPTEPEAAGKSISPEDFVPAFPEPPECGVTNASFSRVVGGVDAKLGDFPWMALLGYQKRNNPTQWLCGGSLITSKHVLTASHCIHNQEPFLYVVRLGELDLSREDDGAAPVDILIKHRIKHEQYDPKGYTNDIGLLVLEKEVQFTDLIHPICLPQNTELRSMTFEDYNPMVAGWGNIAARGPAAAHLQVLQLPVVSNDYCKGAYRNYTLQKIDERVLCAGFKKGGKDSCKGDSGGPLMQPIYNSQTYKTYFFQIGVVSFGKGCAEAGFPGVYSRVTHFMPWLQQKVLGQA